MALFIFGWKLEWSEGSGNAEKELKISSLLKDREKIHHIILFSEDYLFYQGNPLTDAGHEKNIDVLFFVKLHAARRRLQSGSFYW